MSKILYANGCSWTFGNGISADPNFPHTGNYDMDFTLGHKRYSWPAVLATNLSYLCINDSLGSGSNKRIVRTTCNFLMNIPKNQYKDIIVVIGWTTIERNEIHHYDTNKWIVFNARQQFSSTSSFNLSGEEYYKKMVDEYQKLYVTYVYSEVENLTNYVHQKYVLSNLLENLGIKYIFFDSLPPSFIGEPKFNYEVEFEKIKNNNMITDISFMDFCNLNNIPVSSCVHPMIEGHKIWANKLYDKLFSLYGDQL
ncbi:MAG TPA: DUF6071 family protein [Nitrososphaeraceae archaeon]